MAVRLKSKLFLVGSLFLSLFFLFSIFVSGTFAQTLQQGLKSAVTEKEGITLVNTSTDLESQIANIVRLVLGLLGVVALLVVISAGFLYTISAGGEQAKTARNLLVYGAIGLIIIFGAYTISGYIIKQLQTKTLTPTASFNSLFGISTAKAQGVEPFKKLASFSEKSGYAKSEDPSISVYVGQILSIVYGFLGVIALILIIYAGFKWMLSKGEKAEIESAQKIIASATIGLAILFGAYIITGFIISSLQG